MDKHDPGELNLFKLKVITRFALSVCIEFKNGHITYTNLGGIDKVAEINAILHNEWLKDAFVDNAHRLNHPKPETEEKQEEKSYKELFVEKYYARETYNFYNSIYDFMTGGNDFDLKALLIELKINIDDRRQQVFRQDELLNLLGYPDVYDLSNSELIALTEELFEFALKGQLPLDRYLTVFHYMERFTGILKNVPDEIVNKLIDAVQQHADNFRYIPMLREHFTVRSDQKNFEYFRKLFLELNKVNDHVKDLKNQKIDLDLFESFKKDPSTFYKAALEQYSDRSILKSWNFSEFYNIVKDMNSTQLRALNAFLKNRYSLYEMPKWMEIEFLKNLFDKISLESHGEETLKRYIFENMVEVLAPILKMAQQSDDV